MPAAEEESKLAQAVEVFRRISKHVASELESAVTEAPGPTQNLIARLAVAAVRQAEALAALYQAGPFYAGPIGQLLRGLVEMWRLAAWLTAPDRTLSRNQRAIGLWIKSLNEERETLEVQQGIEGIEPRPEKLAEVDRQEELIRQARNELLGEANPRQPNGARNDYEALGRPDRYVVFRRESETAHVGAIALGQMVAYQDDTHVHLGGVSRIGDRARLLVLAWDALADITDIVTAELGLDARRWQDLRAKSYSEFQTLLLPLVEGG